VTVQEVFKIYRNTTSSRDELHDVLKSLYEEKYSGSDRIVLYY